MSYEVEPGGYLLDEENFGEHSIELINGEKNGSVWLIVYNEKFLVKTRVSPTITLCGNVNSEEAWGAHLRWRRDWTKTTTFTLYGCTTPKSIHVHKEKSMYGFTSSETK